MIKWIFYMQKGGKKQRKLYKVKRADLTIDPFTY